MPCRRNELLSTASLHLLAVRSAASWAWMTRDMLLQHTAARGRRYVRLLHAGRQPGHVRQGLREERDDGFSVLAGQVRLQKTGRTPIVQNLP